MGEKSTRKKAARRARQDPQREAHREGRQAGGEQSGRNTDAVESQEPLAGRDIGEPPRARSRALIGTNCWRVLVVARTGGWDHLVAWRARLRGGGGGP